MDDFKRLDEKLDKVVERIGNIDVTLGKQSVILDEHVKRTNLLEAKIEPIEKHVIMVNGVLKLIGIAAGFLALLEGIIKLFGE